MTKALSNMTKPEIVAEYEAQALDLSETRAELAEARKFIAQTDTPNPAKAMAEFLHNDGMVWDRDTRSEVPGNTVAFLQRFHLNGYINQLHFGLTFFEQKLEEAQQRAKQVYAQGGADDEISRNKIQQAIRWVEQRHEEVTLTKTLIEEGMTQYERVTGETWSPRPKHQRQAEANAPSKSDLEAQMAALGIEVPDVATPQTNGVEKADDQVPA